ncbi:MAG: AAA family ATPase, partial [Anaerolineae bacterium]
MYKSLYLTTTEPRCGKSLVSLGIAERLLRRTRRLAVFRPIIGSDQGDQRDKNIDLLLTHFQLDQPYEDTYVFRTSEAIDLLAKRETDELTSRVIKKYKELEDHYDFVLCVGSDLSAEGTAFEFDVNVAIAQSLGSPVLILGRADREDIDEVLSPITIALDEFHSKGCPIVGIAVNRTLPEQVDQIRETLRRELPEELLVWVLPEDHMLASPTLDE